MFIILLIDILFQISGNIYKATVAKLIKEHRGIKIAVIDLIRE